MSINIHACDDVVDYDVSYFPYNRIFNIHEGESNGGAGSTRPPLVNTTEQLMGSGCLEFIGETGIYNFYLGVGREGFGSNWFGDLRDKKLILRIMQKTGPRRLTLGLIGGGPDGWGWNPYNLLPEFGTSMPLNEWVEFEVDLRVDSSGQPIPPSDLQYVRSISINCNARTAGCHLLFDAYEAQDAVGEIPLGAQITPLADLVDVGIMTTVQANIYGGTLPYFVRWYIDGDPVKEETVDALATVTFQPVEEKTYEVYATILDNSGRVLTTEISKISVLGPPPPAEPCRPIHCVGNKVYDSAGSEVKLRGVNALSMIDASAPHTLDQDGVIRWGNNGFNEEAILEMIDGLRLWRVNCIRSMHSLGGFLTDRDNYQANIKWVVEQLSNKGIYVVLPFWWVGWYGAEGDFPQTAMPYDPYLTADETALLAPYGSSGTGFTKEDFVNAYLQWAEMFRPYPNVIFELWNEPHGDVATREEWWETTQLAINALRVNGFNNVIVIQWGYGLGVYYPTYPPDVPQDGENAGLVWAKFGLPVTDPLNNLMVSTHLYRWGGGSGYTAPPGSYNVWQDRQTFYKYEDILETYKDGGLISIGRQVPVLIGEVGGVGQNSPAPDGTDPQEADVIFLGNLLKIAREEGWITLPWVFRPNVSYALVTTEPNYTPTESGQLVIDHNKILAASTSLEEGTSGGLLAALLLGVAYLLSERT